MVDTRVCCDPLQTQEAYEVAMHSMASDWELFVTLRKQKNKEMKRLKRALFSRDADATASLWRKHGSRQPGGQQSSCATRDPDPCPQIVRLYAKASEPRMERK
jgi:hypothetical protein